MGRLAIPRGGVRCGVTYLGVTFDDFYLMRVVRRIKFWLNFPSWFVDFTLPFYLFLINIAV